MRSQFQFTLPELLFVVAFAALGAASLVTGGAIGAIVVSLAMAVTMGLASVAFVGRCSRQAFAIGFLIPVIVYAAVVLAVGRSEFDPYAGQFPTSRLLRPVFAVIAKRTWIDMATGQAVADYEPASDPNLAGGPEMYAATKTISESPDRRTFMSLGHLLFAMMVGYAGAKFAIAVHCRERKDDEQDNQQRAKA